MEAYYLVDHLPLEIFLGSKNCLASPSREVCPSLERRGDFNEVRGVNDGKSAKVTENRRRGFFGRGRNPWEISGVKTLSSSPCFDMLSREEGKGRRANVLLTPNRADHAPTREQRQEEMIPFTGAMADRVLLARKQTTTGVTICLTTKRLTCFGEALNSGILIVL